MNQVSLEERRLFALRIHASHAFATVVDICKRLLETPIKMDDPIYRSLVAAIYTTYGRPFTKSWGFGKLADDQIPDEYRELHEEIMTLRDKMYAHADKDMVHEDYGPTNDIRINISPQGECRIWTQPVQGTNRQVKAILSLANCMRGKMDYWIDKFMDNNLKTITDVEFPPGDYLLDTENETGLLIKRDAEQANQERLRISRAVSLCSKSEAPHSDR